MTALGVLEVLQGSNSHLEKIHRCLEVSPVEDLELTVNKITKLRDYLVIVFSFILLLNCAVLDAHCDKLK